MVKRLVSVFLTGCIPILAFAQQNQSLRDRDPDLAASKKLAADLQQANLHRGPFYLSSMLRVSDAGFTSGGTVVPTGSTSSGISLGIEAPQRLYFVPHKKTVFSAEFVPGYTFFTEGDANDQFNYSLRADAHFLLNHLYLDVYALRADQIRAHIADLNSLATTKEDETGVAGELKYSSRTSALFAVRFRDTSYPSDRYQPREPGNPELPDVELPVEVLDRDERDVRVSFMHKTFPRTSLFVSGEASEYDFPNQRAMNSRRTFFGGGFLVDRGRTQFRLEGGPMRLDFDDPAERDFEGVTASLSLTRGNGRTNYSLAAERDIGFSIFLDNRYFISTAASVGVDRVSTRRLTLHAGVTAARYEYDTPVFGQERSDDIIFPSVGFTYGLRRLRAGLDVGWYERTSTAFGDEESGIRYVLRLSFTP